MRNIEEILEEGRKICMALRDKIVKELPELDMTNSNIQDSIFDDNECYVILGLPNFYCCGERCNFEVYLVIEGDDVGEQVITCLASISGLSSFNSYFNDTQELFNSDGVDKIDSIDKIVDIFYVIIENWVKNPASEGYMVAFNNPILADSNCIATMVFDTIQGDISIDDIKKSSKYLPKHIVACDSVSIVDGAIDQLVVIFSADVTDDSSDTITTVLVFRGFSNFTARAKESIGIGSEQFKLTELTSTETINDLPINIYTKLRFCSDQLGIDLVKYIGYAESNSLNDFLLNDFVQAYGYSKTVIVNGEPSITG